MKKFGRDLDFISQINRDGAGTSSISEKYIEILNGEELDLTCLSLTEETYIASGFNSFVVKIKKQNGLDIQLPETYEEIEIMAKQFEEHKASGTVTHFQSYCAGAKAMLDKMYKAMKG